MEVCTTALQAWKEVDLDSKRHLWENQCLEIKEHKNSSVVTRKHLNESTKSFRSELASTGGKSVPVEAFMELLKSYQEEIDRLSKRAKYGEGCFVELVKVISAPMDPVSAISTLLKMNASDNTLIAEQSLELERLQNELQEYDAEFATLKNQDIKIQRLEEQVADYRDSIEEQVEKQVELRAAEIAAEAEARRSELDTLMQHSERKYQNAVDALTSTQQRLEAVQNQCYEISSAQEDKLSHLSAENASLAETVYRSSLRVAELESQVAGLQAQRKASPAVPATPSAAYDDSESLHSIIADLRAEMAAKEAASRGSRLAQEQRVSELGAALAVEREKAGAVAGLQRELESCRVIVGDYESLRKQYKVLQSIVFPTGAAGSTVDSGSEVAEGGDARSFDMLLSARIKALDSELIGARNALRAAQELETRSAATIARLGEELAAKTVLVKRLELELDRAIRSESGAGGALVSAEAAQMDELSALLQDPSETIKAPANAKSGSPRGDKVGGGAEGEGEGGGEASMVTVLQSQRNHFRDRLAEINKQYLVLQRQSDAVEVTNKTLESENVALYAKIKYLQSCTSATPQARAYPVPVDIEGGSSQKYEQLYEQKLNPFDQFSSAERNRKLQELNIGERMLLSTTVACVSSPTGRSVLMVYVVTMHALVFFTLYYTAHRTVICHH